MDYIKEDEAAGLPDVTMRELMRWCRAIAEEKGWSNLTPELFIAWAHRELSEGMEQLLKGHGMAQMWRGPDGKPEGFLPEMADVFILLGHMLALVGPDMFLYALRAKLDYNATRPRRHGRRSEGTELGYPLWQWPAIREQYGKDGSGQ